MLPCLATTTRSGVQPTKLSPTKLLQLKLPVKLTGNQSILNYFDTLSEVWIKTNQQAQPEIQSARRNILGFKGTTCSLSTFWDRIQNQLTLQVRSSNASKVWGHFLPARSRSPKSANHFIKNLFTTLSTRADSIEKQFFSHSAVTSYYDKIFRSLCGSWEWESSMRSKLIIDNWFKTEFGKLWKNYHNDNEQLVCKFPIPNTK